MSNLQGSQEQYVDYCNIPLPPKQKYASFDAPVSLFLEKNRLISFHKDVY